MFWNDEKVLSTFKYNVELFTARFPDLVKAMGFLDSNNFSTLLKQIPETYNLLPCKKNINAKTLKINNRFLHSKYDSVNEAEKLLENDFFANSEIKKSVIFAGLGLGYLAEVFIKNNPNTEIILIEPDIYSFLLFLCSRKLNSIFSHNKLILLVGLPPSDVFNFLLASKYEYTPIFYTPSIKQVSVEWYNEFETLIKRNEVRLDLNKNTARKFAKLWLRNACKNLNAWFENNSINIFEKKFVDTPAVILAAGPSLDKHLRILKKYSQKNFLIIAVDTAVKACKKLDLPPDFIITGDPQFWNYLHIAGINCKDSILVSEETVFPASLRINARAHILYTQNLPFRQYYNTKVPERGVLQSGGSITTTAWSFANYLGCRNIIMMGLDLGYPNGQTHFKGSTFEERMHITSDRINPVELSTAKSFLNIAPEFMPSYDSEKVLTDKRLKMYAWWLESEVAKSKNAKTFNFLPLGIRIPGIGKMTETDFEQILFSTKMNRVGINEKINEALLNRPVIKLNPINVFDELQTELKLICDECNSLKFQHNAEKIERTRRQLQTKPFYNMLARPIDNDYDEIARISNELYKIIKKYTKKN